jgi:hypothetical protein
MPASAADHTFAAALRGQKGGSSPLPVPEPIGAPMNTRTIAIAALVIAVILLIIFLV